MAEPTLVKATFKIEEQRNEMASIAMGAQWNYGSHVDVSELTILGVLSKTDKIWIYNVSTNAHRLSSSLFKNVDIPPCGENEQYSVVTSLPSVVVQPVPDLQTGDTNYAYIDGRRAAMDLINPDNLGLDQDSPPRLSATSIGNNYSKKGVFFSLHNPPLKKEVKAAQKRMRDYYTDLVDKAQVLSIASAAKAMLTIPEEELEAAFAYLNAPKIKPLTQKETQ